jgi:tetratricopeptide (TPR) repeat protein
VALFRETGNPAGQAEALNGLGEAFLAAGRLAAARAHLHDALGLASQLADQYEQARAHHGLGRAWHALGDSGQARGQWRRALALYARLGAPEADQIRTELAGASRSGASIGI